MNDIDVTNSPSATAADLQLIFPSMAPVCVEAPTATVEGESSDTATALDAIASQLVAAGAPAVAGLDGMTLDAIDAAVRLADRHDAMILPHPAAAPEPARQRVSQHGSLDAACDAELIVWVGCNGETSAVTRRIAERQLRAAFVNADLSTVLKLRATHAAEPAAEPIGSFKRVAAVLAHDAEPRVISQWHRLAASLQTTVRMSVLQLPDPAMPHRRAVEEVTTWLTGVSPTARGGIAFVDGHATPCPTLTRLLTTGAVDFVLWLGSVDGMPSTLDSFAAIATGPTPTAPTAITLPPLGIGQSGNVMRFDGTTFNLSNEQDAPADVMAELLRQLLAK